jgi:hypothetical protein
MRNKRMILAALLVAPFHPALFAGGTTEGEGRRSLLLHRGRIPEGLCDGAKSPSRLRPAGVRRTVGKIERLEILETYISRGIDGVIMQIDSKY